MNFFEKFNPNIFNKNLGSSQRYTAFTLAEVLITLAIIGVVAALTIPTLMQKQQEKQTVTAVKKAYSELSQAYTFAVQENGTPENWELTDSFPSPVGAGILLDKIAPYLKLIQNCGTSNGCFKNVTYRGLNNVPGYNFYSNASFAKAILADGSNIAMFVHDKDCSIQRGNSPALKNVCGDIWVDVNGEKPPNQYGVDMFLFWISRTGITPIGSEEDINFEFSNYCNLTNATLYENGVGCTAWVLYNENMDYMHCNDLSWSGKTKCD